MMTVVEIHSETRLGKARLYNLRLIVIAPERSSIDCIQVACWLVSVRRLEIFMDACSVQNDDGCENLQ